MYSNSNLENHKKAIIRLQIYGLIAGVTEQTTMNLFTTLILYGLTVGYFNNIRSVDLSLDGLMMFVSFNSDMTGVSNGGDTDNTSG